MSRSPNAITNPSLKLKINYILIMIIINIGGGCTSNYKKKARKIMET
ncbi:MAG TPA: hypothetical protein VFS97_07245 [Nitrososphaeraceae archaeon]|nr:hypothetical protein [Nitrososphaeraceae archaeon]